MSSLDDTLNQASSWFPKMQPPSSFSFQQQRDYQQKVNEIVGTHDGASIVKLAWAPHEWRWRPHALDVDAPGYTFPIFFYGYNEDGAEVAAPRWVLLERVEPETYTPTWESGRFSVHEGKVWDWKGPCPPERYTEMWCHAYHDGNCCPCRGDVCTCGAEYDHCWGLYRDPDEGLLNRLRRAKSRIDASNDQVIDSRKIAREKLLADVNKETMDYWLRQPKSGLYLLN